MSQDKPIKSKLTHVRFSEDNTYYPDESSEERNQEENKKLALELLELEESRERELKLAEKELCRITAEYKKTNKSISKLQYSNAILKRMQKWSDSLYKENTVASLKCRASLKTMADNLGDARKHLNTCNSICENLEKTRKLLEDFKKLHAQSLKQLQNCQDRNIFLRNEIQSKETEHNKKVSELSKQKSEIISKYGDLSVKVNELNDELAKEKAQNAAIIKNIEETESIGLNLQEEIDKLQTDMEKMKEATASMKIVNEIKAALLTKEADELDKSIQKKLGYHSDLEKEINSLGDEKASLEAENVNLFAEEEKANTECAEIEALVKCEEEKRIDATHNNQLKEQEQHTLIKALEDEQKFVINELSNKNKLVQSWILKVEKDEEINNNLEYNIAEMEKKLVEVKEQIKNDKKKYEHMVPEYTNLQQRLNASIDKTNKLNVDIKSSNDTSENEIIQLRNECREIEMDIESQAFELENVNKMLYAEEEKQKTKDSLAIETAETEISDLRKQLETIQSEYKDLEESLVPVEVEYTVMQRKVNMLQHSNKMKKEAILRERKPKPQPSQPKIPKRAESNQPFDAMSSSSIEAPSLWEFEQKRKERQRNKKMLQKRKETTSSANKQLPGPSNRL